MKKISVIFFFHFVAIAMAQNVQSPSKNITLDFSISAEGKPTYSISYKNKTIVKESTLAIELKGMESLEKGFTILKVTPQSVKEEWNPVLGEQTTILNEYNQMTYELAQKVTNRKLNIIFKVYNEGVAFRYEFPKQSNLDYFIISDEKTQFNLLGNHKTFWLPGDFDSQEYPYMETKLSEVNTDNIDRNNGIGLKSIAGKYVIQSPLMMKSTEGIYINIFEAAVVNYPVMHLDLIPNEYQLTSHLVPNAIGDKAYLHAPCVSPWRTIMISDDARDIVSSKMILNLNR